jgi:hypothetical protein
LALTYARDLAGESGLVKKRLDLDEQRLPILLPLREFARYLIRQHPDAWSRHNVRPIQTSAVSSRKAR